MSSLSALFLLLASRQDADPKIEYRSVAVPVSRAFSEINKIAGTSWNVSPAIKNEIVVCRISGQTASQVKAKFAIALYAEWVKAADGSEFLTPSVTLRNEQSRKNLAERTQMFKDWIARFDARPEPEKLTSSTPSEAPLESIDRSSIGPALAIAKSLRPSDLAAINKGGRVVYATNPTKMQRLLSVPKLDQIIDNFVKMHNSQLGSVETEQDPSAREQAQQVLKGLGIEMNEPKKITAPVAKVLGIVERFDGGFGTSEGVMLNAVLFDAKGQVLAMDQLMIGGDSNIMALATPDAGGTVAIPSDVEDQDEKQPKVDPRLDKKLELSSTSKELSARTMGFNPLELEKPLSPELADFLKNPDLHDPLSFVMSEALIQISENLQTSLIAVVSDNLDSFGTIERQGDGAKLSTIDQQFRSLKSIQVNDSDGFRIVRPRDPIDCESSRIDRLSLKKLIEVGLSSDVLSLESLAQFAKGNPDPSGSSSAIKGFLMLCPQHLSMLMKSSSEWTCLNFYGNLSAAERNTLRSGQLLPFSSVNPTSKSLVLTMIYGAGTRINVGPMKDEPSGGGMFAGFMARTGTVSNFQEEPTEVIPNGLPMEGGIRLDVKTSSFVKSESKSFMSSILGAMGPEELATMKFFSESKEMGQFASMMPKLDRLRIGDMDKLRFNFWVGKEIWQQHVLTDHRISKDSRPMAFEDLPKDFLEAVNKHLKLMQEGLAPMMNPFGGGVVPPSQ